MENRSHLVRCCKHYCDAYRCGTDGSTRDRNLRRCYDRYQHALPPITHLDIHSELSFSAHNCLRRIADLFRLRDAAARSAAQERLGCLAHRLLLPCRATHVPAVHPGWRLLAVAFGNVPALRPLYRACPQIPSRTPAILYDRPRADGCDDCVGLLDDIDPPHSKPIVVTIKRSGADAVSAPV